MAIIFPDFIQAAGSVADNGVLINGAGLQSESGEDEYIITLDRGLAQDAFGVMVTLRGTAFIAVSTVIHESDRVKKVRIRGTAAPDGPWVPVELPFDILFFTYPGN